MPEGQKYIYYACGESASKLDKLPQAENVREKGYEILYLTDDIDEFVVKTLGKFEDKEFRSVNDDDLDLESEDEKKETEQLEKEYKDVLDFVKDSLDGRIAAAKLSHKLKSAPVCLTTQGGISLEMERYFAAVNSGMSEHMKAERVLELNATHPVFEALKGTFVSDKEKAKKYAELLYAQAQLIAGVSLDDPARFAALVSELMV